MPTPLADDGGETDGGGGGAGPSKEVEIVFKLHPCMGERAAEAVEALRDGATRYIKTTARAQIEHLCKYLAMRISLDLPPSMAASSSAPQPASPHPTRFSPPFYSSLARLRLTVHTTMRIRSFVA